MQRLWIVTPPTHRLACVHLESVCVRSFKRIFRFHLTLAKMFAWYFSLNRCLNHLIYAPKPQYEICALLMRYIFSSAFGLCETVQNKKKYDSKFPETRLLAIFHRRRSRFKCQINLRNPTRVVSLLRSFGLFGTYLVFKKCLDGFHGVRSLRWTWYMYRQEWEQVLSARMYVYVVRKWDNNSQTANTNQNKQLTRLFTVSTFLLFFRLFFRCYFERAQTKWKTLWNKFKFLYICQCLKLFLKFINCACCLQFLFECFL